MSFYAIDAYYMARDREKSKRGPNNPSVKSSSAASDKETSNATASSSSSSSSGSSVKAAASSHDKPTAKKLDTKQPKQQQYDPSSSPSSPNADYAASSLTPPNNWSELNLSSRRPSVATTATTATTATGRSIFSIQSTKSNKITKAEKGKKKNPSSPKTPGLFSRMKGTGTTADSSLQNHRNSGGSSSSFSIGGFSSTSSFANPGYNIAGGSYPRRDTSSSTLPFSNFSSLTDVIDIGPEITDWMDYEDAYSGIERFSPSASSPAEGPPDWADKTPTGSPRRSTATLPSSERESTFVWKDGRRYHKYPVSIAPYPQSYDPTILELERTNHIMLNKICGSPSLYAVDGIEVQPPKNVLDLGCGNGLWVMDAAKAWPDTSFVGIDLVLLQPDLELVSDDLRARIQWIHSNFLDALPFPSSHFDLVHMRRVARGVPETKWSSLLKEISRVLRPGGRLEIIEDDLSFPGGLEQQQYSSPISPSALSSRNEVNMAQEGSSTPTSPTWDLFHTSDPRDHSRLEQAYNHMHAHRRINLLPTSLLSELLPRYFDSVRTPTPSWTNATSPSSPLSPYPEQKSWRAGGARAISGNSFSHSLSPASAPVSPVHLPGGGEDEIKGRKPSTVTNVIGGGSPPRQQGDSRPNMFLSPMSAGGEFSSPSNRSMTTSVSDAGTSFGGSPPERNHSPLASRSAQRFSAPSFGTEVDRITPSSHGIGSRSVLSINQNDAQSPTASASRPAVDLKLQYSTVGAMLSVAEVLGCRESIWSYLMEMGQAIETTAEAASKRRAVVVDGAAGSVVDRHEFEQWFVKYERDMATRFAMAKALRRRFQQLAAPRGRGLSFTDAPQNSGSLSALDISTPIIPLTDPDSSIFSVRGHTVTGPDEGEEEGDGEEDYDEEEEEEDGEEGEEEEEDTDSRLHYGFQNLGLDDTQSIHSFTYAHPSSVSLLGHEGDGRPIEQVYSVSSPQTATAVAPGSLPPQLASGGPVPPGDYTFSAMGGEGKASVGLRTPVARPTIETADAYRSLGPASLTLSPLSLSMAQREEDMLRTSRNFRMFIVSHSRFTY
ncbi:hypothetical protein FRC14_005475 [Serendipita sp. 396]|nr:hypothetical protein FRC14_005475 [Serendipita sp. 396]